MSTLRSMRHTTRAHEYTNSSVRILYVSETQDTACRDMLSRTCSSIRFAAAHLPDVLLEEVLVEVQVAVRVADADRAALACGHPTHAGERTPARQRRREAGAEAPAAAAH